MLLPLFFKNFRHIQPFSPLGYQVAYCGKSQTVLSEIKETQLTVVVVCSSTQGSSHTVRSSSTSSSCCCCCCCSSSSSSDSSSSSSRNSYH